jgi:hypothetical protein
VTVTGLCKAHLGQARVLDPAAVAAARGLTVWRHKVVVHPKVELRLNTGTLGRGVVRITPNLHDDDSPRF